MRSCLSFGAGVQTTALLVLIVQGRWPRPDAIVFADTGHEHVETYSYLADINCPLARRHGMAIVTLGPDWRSKHYAADLETYCIEHRMLPGTWVRWCTDRYKVKPIHRYLKKILGATSANPVESWIGISTDEAKRQRLSTTPYEILRYPLIELGLSRKDCENTITAAGLPVPPKSGCWFCPFKGQSAWYQMRREHPELFERALKMENNARSRNEQPKYLPMFGPLKRIAQQLEFAGFDEAIKAEAGCVSGSCFV